jgi:hypothetical protein
MTSRSKYLPLSCFTVILLLPVRSREPLANLAKRISRKSDNYKYAQGLRARNIAELLVQLALNQSDTIIGKQGRKYVPFFGTFFFFILLATC